MKKWQLVVLEYLGSWLGKWAKKKIDKRQAERQNIDKEDKDVV